MRASVLVVVVSLATASRLHGQGLFTDARRIGMAGVSLTLDGTLTRYNPAYRGVPSRQMHGGAKVTIPAPFGLIKFFGDHPISHLSKDALFNPDSARFNPVELLNLILNPPLFYEIKQVPTPVNDIEFTVGQDSLIVDLGNAQHLIPTDPFGINGSSRLLDIGPSFRGVRVGVMAWLNEQIDLRLGDSLLGFLKEGHPARHQTNYNVIDSALVQGGLAPSLSYSGKVFGTGESNLYLGVAAHYYVGAAYARSNGSGGFTTGDTIFAGANPVTPNFTGVSSYSKWGNSYGHGIGADVGFAWVSGPIVFGFGVNDIGAKITWSDTRIDYQRYDTASNKLVTDSSKTGVETTTTLPTSYLANVVGSPGTELEFAL